MKEDTFIRIDFLGPVDDRLLEGQSPVAALPSLKHSGCSYCNGQRAWGSKQNSLAHRNFDAG